MHKLKHFFNFLTKPFRWFRHTRLRNKLIVLIIVAVLGYFIYKQITSSNAQPQYLTQAAEKTTITQIVSETGNIETTGRVGVYSNATGIIEEIYVEDHSQVKINQKLFKVRSTATEEEKASAYAAYQNAATAYNQALNTYRDKQAVAEKVEDDVKDHDSDETFTQKATRTTAQAARDSAYDATRSTEAALKSTELAYRATQNVTVKATASGTITNLSYHVGDKVTANTNTNTSGTPVLVIADLTEYRVKLALNEVDIPKVKTRQTAKITLDAFPGQIFNGLVTHIDSVGTNTSGVITYNVIITITDPQESIRPVMTANVDIEVDKAENVLTVPNSAIKPYEGKKAVQIVDPETKTAKYIPVEVGIKSPEKTEIKNGIQEGMEVTIGTKNGAVKTSGGGMFGSGD